MKKYTLICLLLFSSLCFTANGNNNKQTNIKTTAEATLNDEVGTNNFYVLNEGDNTISSYTLGSDPFENLKFMNKATTKAHSTQIENWEYSLGFRYIYVIADKIITQYQVDKNGAFMRRTKRYNTKFSLPPTNIKFFSNYAYITGPAGCLIRVKMSRDGQLNPNNAIKLATKDKTATTLTVEKYYTPGENFHNKFLVLDNKNNITVIQSDPFHFKYLGNFAIPSLSGIVLEMTRKPGYDNKFLLLTTKEIVSIEISGEASVIKILSKYPMSQELKNDSHIKFVTPDLFVVTTGKNNQALYFNVVERAFVQKIVPQPAVDVDYPKGIDIGIYPDELTSTFVTNNNKDTISKIDRGSVYIVAKSDSTTNTLNQPSTIKFVHWRPDIFNKTAAIYVLNRHNNSISSYILNPKPNEPQSNNLATGYGPRQIETIDFGSGNRYVFVTNYMEGSISEYKADANGLLSLLNTYDLGSGTEPTDIKIFYHYVPHYTKAFIISQKGELIRYTVEKDGSLISKITALTNPHPLSVEQVNDTTYLVLNSSPKTISIFNSSEDALTKTKDLPLEGISGDPIEIVKDDISRTFFLLTTAGIYSGQFDVLKYSLPLKEIHRQAFDPNSHIKITGSEGFAVTTGPSNTVEIFSKNDTGTITKTIATDYPSAIDYGYDPNTGWGNIFITKFYENTLNQNANENQSFEIIPGIGELNRPSALKYVQWKNN